MNQSKQKKTSFRISGLLLCCCIGFIGFPLNLWAQSSNYGDADRIISVVGKNKIVLLSDLESQYTIAKLQNPEMNDSFKCQMLTEMIVQKILVEQAERDSILVSPEEIEANIDNKIRYYIRSYGSQEKLEEISGKTIYQLKEDNKDIVREQMLAERMRGSILESVKITPAEVKAFYDKVPLDSLPFYPATIEAGQIVLDPTVSAEIDEITRKKLADIRKSIVDEGKSFEMMAGIYSEDPGSRDEGGLLKDVTREGFVAPFVNAAFKLQNGEVSPIVKTEFGYHIIQMVNRKGDKIDVRHILIRPARTRSDYDLALKNLDSIKQIITDKKMSFSEAVGKFSKDPMAKQTGGMIVHPESGSSELEISDLDGAMVMLLDTLKQGQYSAPQLFYNERGEQSARIVYLKTKTSPHKANLQDDYSKIQQVAMQMKQAEKFETWLKTKAPNYYIRIDPTYHNCESLRNWKLVHD